MKTRSIVALLAATCGLWIAGGQAHAQSFSTYASASDPLAAGMWDVTATNVGGDVFDITVKADGTSNPNVDSEHISVNFYSSIVPQVATQINASSAAGGTNGTTSPFAPGNNWNPDLTGGNARFQVPPGSPIGTALSHTGANIFTGVVTLTGGTAESFSVGIQDSTAQWYGQATIVPEGASLALLLPGLIPLGIALRRRVARA